MFCFSETQEEKTKKKSFRLGKQNMSSKMVGWLVGAGDGKILELRKKSGMNNKSGTNPFLLVHMFSRIFQEFPGFSKIPELVL